MKTQPLVVKPVLTYSEYSRQPHTSWREWGSITSRAEAGEEASRIKAELESLKQGLDFPVEFLELAIVSTLKEVVEIEEDLRRADVAILYAAGGGVGLLNEIAKRKKTLVFVRWKSGAYYLWHEIVDARLIRLNTSDTPVNPWISRDDVFVDDYEALVSRLRALYALKNMKNRRVLCIGGAWGWEVGVKAVENAVKTWNLDLVFIPYSELEREVKRVSEEEGEVVKKIMNDYLNSPGVEVKIPLQNVYKAFVLYKALKNLADKYKADVVTSPGCMTEVIRLAETPPCLSYSVLNDEDILSVCEGDFVALPVFILLRLISGKPVFFANPSQPVNGEVLVAHCTAPRKMNGVYTLPSELYTHFESDEGAAIRVLMNKGQVVTVVNPSFDGKAWVVFKGIIVDTPFYPACRTQVVIRVVGDWVKLKNNMRGFHWLIVYGDYVESVKSVAKEVGIEVITL